MGLHAPDFQQTCPRHDFNVNKISEYKHRVFPRLSVARVTMTPFISIKEGRIMNFGGHLEKFGGQNPQNSKTQGVMENPVNIMYEI